MPAAEVPWAITGTGVSAPEPEEKLNVKSSDLGDTMRLVVLGVS